MLTTKQLYSVIAAQFVALIAVSHMATGIHTERTWLREAYFTQLGLAQQTAQEVGVITEVAIQYREEVAVLRQEQRRLRFESYIRSVNPQAPAEEIVEAVLLAESETGIDATWLLAKQKQESYFDPKAVSRTGCRGLTQMCLAASKDVGLNPAHAFQVRANVLAGARYLKIQLDATGSMQRALTRYNGNDDPLFVQRIERHRARLLMGIV
jgi:hypothetical protein